MTTHIHKRYQINWNKQLLCYYVWDYQAFLQIRMIVTYFIEGSLWIVYNLVLLFPGMPGVGEAGTVPGEDRYAALKDLDCLMKSQQPQPVEQMPSEWGSGW